MIRILSTKKLAVNQKQFLLNAGFSVVEADFIAISFQQIILKTIHQNLIFTSSNAVKAIKQETAKLKDKPCFCVGEKTKALLEQNGFKVLETTESAEELSKIISNEYANEAFTFFSGNLRLNELPNALNEAKIKWNEQQVYTTTLNPIDVNTNLDGILFFSPSGVESFLQKNRITTETCFCIGKTTAKALENKTSKIIIANKPSVENVVIQCIRHFQNPGSQS